MLEFCSKCGEVSQLIVSPFHKGHGICIYYDLRIASKAVTNLNCQYLNKRMVFVKYASEKSISFFRNPEDICSTIQIRSTSKKTSLNINEIKDKMLLFGEVKSCTQKSNKRFVKNGWIVQFYDFRSAQKCIQNKIIRLKEEDLTVSYKIDKDYNNQKQNSIDCNVIYNYETNKKDEKLARFKNPTKVKDEIIFQYASSHTESQTRIKYSIGSNRIRRIQRQLGQGIKRRRKTTIEQDSFIAQSAFDGVPSSIQILANYKKKISLFKYFMLISHKTIKRKEV